MDKLSIIQSQSNNEAPTHRQTVLMHWVSETMVVGDSARPEAALMGKDKYDS